MRTEFHAKRVPCEVVTAFILSPGREAAAHKRSPVPAHTARWMEEEGGGGRCMGVKGGGSRQYRCLKICPTSVPSSRIFITLSFDNNLFL